MSSWSPSGYLQVRLTDASPAIGEFPSSSAGQSLYAADDDGRSPRTFASAVNSTVTSTDCSARHDERDIARACARERDHAATKPREPLRDPHRSHRAVAETCLASSPARSRTVCDQPTPARTAALDSMMPSTDATGVTVSLHPAAASAIAARTASAAGRAMPSTTLECGLEARARAVVAKAEEAHVRDVRITDRSPHELGVDARPA